MNVKQYLASIGRKGGKAKSAAKTAAARKANAARWRNHKNNILQTYENKKRDHRSDQENGRNLQLAVKNVWRIGSEREATL